MFDQINGIIRAITPLLVAVLVSWGLDDTTAGLVIGAVTAVAAAVWSWFSNRITSQAESVVQQTDVKITVGPNASQAMKHLASDPAQPKIVPGP